MDIGCVAGFSGQLKHTELFYKFSSQITPGTIYHVDLSTSGQPLSKVHITTKVTEHMSSRGLQFSKFVIHKAVIGARYLLDIAKAKA